MAVTISTPGGQSLSLPTIRRIGPEHVAEALKLGWRDFMRRPTSILFLFVVYPVIGVATFFIAARQDALYLVYPLATGFALVAPIISAGVMELSRREVGGGQRNLRVYFEAYTGPARRGVLLLAALLSALFCAWIFAAELIMGLTMGSVAQPGFADFLRMTLTTSEGLALLLLGNAVGFVFALVALAIGVLSMPMVVDREPSVTRAIATSVQATLQNPVAIAAWGLTVAVTLAVASIPLFAGLIVAVPVLGHANWHLYKMTVER